MIDLLLLVVNIGRRKSRFSNYCFGIFEGADAYKSPFEFSFVQIVHSTPFTASRLSILLPYPLIDLVKTSKNSPFK